MIHLKRMIYRKWNTLFFALVFLLLFTALPYGFYQSWNASLQMAEGVETIERGSYDILLRPAVSSLGAEANLNTLDESFISNMNEFSFDEEAWESIELDSVDPFAEVKANEIFEEIEELVSLPSPKRGGGFTFEEWQQLANDSRIEIAAPIATFGFVEAVPQELMLPLPQTEGNYRYQIQVYTTDGVYDYVLAKEEQIYLEGVPVGEQFYQLPNHSHLLVAVDPISEQKMTGIDLSPLLESHDGMPILQRNQWTTPLILRIEVEAFAEEELVSVINHQVLEVDLTQKLSPFSGGKLILQEDGSLVRNESNQTYFLPEQFLNLNQVEYKVPRFGVEPSPRYMGNLSVEQIASEEVPIYRHRNQMEYIGEPRPPLEMVTVGSFNPDEYTPPTLTAAPLGIYDFPKVMTEGGTQVIPTAIPGSFIAQAASGITNLEAASQVKGEHFIDAIRIRVAGITNFDEQARRQINDLALELANEGHDVTIVAGSAWTYQTLEVDGLGNVELPWIIVGAVPGMARNFDILTFTTISLFTVFMLIWLAVRLKSENSLLSEESDILWQMGWTQGQLRRHELKSQQLFIILLNVASWGFLYLMELPLAIYLINIGLLGASLGVPYVMNLKARLRLWQKPFKAGQAVRYYWQYYLPIIALLWVSYQVISIITASQYRVFLNFNASGMGQSLITPVNSLMIFLLVLAYLMTVIAVFESITVILRERRDEFVLYYLLGWKPKTIYFHLVKESVQWLFHPLLSAASVAVILSLLLSFIVGGTVVFLIVASLVVGCLYFVTEKKIQWNFTTWNWAVLLSALCTVIVLGLVYSPALVLPTILISLFTLSSLSLLILLTIYLCFKKFYKSL